MPRIPNPSFVFPAPALKRDSSPPPLPLRSPARDELVSLSIRQKQERSISSLPASESARPFSAVILDPLSTFLLDSPVEALDIPPALRPSPRSSSLWHDAPEFADDCSKADSQHLFLLAAHHRTRPSTCTNFSHRSSIRSDIEAQIALCDEDPHSHCDPVDLCDELLGHPSRHMDDETVPLVSSPRTDTNLPSPAKDTPVLRRTRRSSKLDYFHWKKPSIVQEPDLTTIPESTLDSSRATDTRRHGTVFHIPHRPYNISAKNMESLHLRDDALNRLEGRVDQTCDLSLAPSSLSQLKGYFVRQNLTVDTQAPAQKTEAPPEVPIDSAYHSAGPSKVSKGSVTTLVNSSGVPSAIPSSTEAMHRHSTSVSSVSRHCRRHKTYMIVSTDQLT